MVPAATVTGNCHEQISDTTGLQPTESCHTPDYADYAGTLVGNIVQEIINKIKTLFLQRNTWLQTVWRSNTCSKSTGQWTPII